MRFAHLCLCLGKLAREVAALGAEPVVYGDGLGGRVRAWAEKVGGVFDTAGKTPVEEIIALVDDPKDVVSIATCLAAYIVAFAFSWGPVMWVMLPEVVSLSVRGAAMGVAVSSQWGADFLVSVSFPSLLSSRGPGRVFLGYAVICGIAFAFVMKFITETKGRSLEEVESDLQETTGLGAHSAWPPVRRSDGRCGSVWQCCSRAWRRR